MILPEVLLLPSEPSQGYSRTNIQDRPQVGPGSMRLSQSRPSRTYLADSGFICLVHARFRVQISNFCFAYLAGHTS